MRLSSAFSSVAAAALLVACGGGGGGNMQPPGSLPPPPNANTYRTAEYNRMGVLNSVNAAEAYALGYTGAGVIVGVVDFNFQLGSGEVDYHPASVGPDPRAVALYEAQIGEPASIDPHGHAVAALIAAKKNDSLMHGIAFDAQVLAVDFFSNVNPTQFQDPVTGELYHISDPWTYITSRGVRVINTSYGYDEGDIISNPPPVTEYYVTESPSLAVVNGALLVASAGNNGHSSPSLSNLDIINELTSLNLLTSGPGAFIIAGSVNGNNQISSFSDRAGTARDHYMVAPGEAVTVPWLGGLAAVSGTSVSAPLISGAAALILERWPNLTGRQVADILLQSATDLGAPGVDSVYGHGLLNVWAALQPMGATAMAVANGSPQPLYRTGIVLSPAFGDAPKFRAALSEVIILDGFGRDFTADASHAVVSRPNYPDLFGVMEQRFRWQGADYALGDQAHFSYMARENRDDSLNAVRPLNGAEDIHSRETVFQFSGASEAMSWSVGTGLSLRDAINPRDADDAFTAVSLTGAFYPMIGVGRGTYATARFVLGASTGLSFGIAEEQVRDTYAGAQFAPDDWSHAAAVRLDHTWGRSRFDFELGALVEPGGILGSLAAGGLKLSDQAATAWTSATAETALDERWSLKASMTIAAAGVQHPGSSLISSLGPIYAASFSFGVAGKNLFSRGDALAFVVGQPLRVEQAPVSLLTGTGRDWTTGGVIMTPAETSLAPSGRAIDFEAAYRFAVADWNIATNLAYSFNANHVPGENAVTAILWLSRKF